MDNSLSFRREVKSQVRSLVSDAVKWLGEHYSDSVRSTTNPQMGVILEGRAFSRYLSKALRESPEFASRGYTISTDPYLKKGKSFYDWYSIQVDDFFASVYRKIQREAEERREFEKKRKPTTSNREGAPKPRDVQSTIETRTLCEVGSG